MGIEFEITANFSTLGRKAELGRATIPLVQDGEYIIIPNTSFYVQAIFTITEPQYHLNEIAGILLDQTYEPYGSIPHKEADQKIISGSKQIMRFPSAPGTKLIPKSGKNDYRVRLAWANRAETVFFTIYSPIPEEKHEEEEGKPDTGSKTEDGKPTLFTGSIDNEWLLKKIIDPRDIIGEARDRIIAKVGIDKAEEIFASPFYQEILEIAEEGVEVVRQGVRQFQEISDDLDEKFLSALTMIWKEGVAFFTDVKKKAKDAGKKVDEWVAEKLKTIFVKMDETVNNWKGNVGLDTLALFALVKDAFIAGLRPYLPSILLYGGLAILGVVLVLSLPRLVGSLTRGVVSGLFKS